MKQTILITGGFGFLGGRLGHYLASYYNVILASRFDKDVPYWSPFSKTVKIDWENQTSLNDACNLVDIIIHTSGLSSQSEPDRALLVNGLYTQNLVNVAVNQGVKKLIYLSTAHVYSKNLLGVITEDTPTKNPHPYATSHVVGEDSVLLAAREKRIEGIVVRLANSFGSPMTKDSNCWKLLVNDLSRQAVIDKSLTLYGNSASVRNFITIRDFCIAIRFLIENNASGIVNMGGGKSCTVGDMAVKVQSNCLSVLGFEPNIIYTQKKSIKENLLDFQTNYLDSVGFKFTDDFDTEIKELIHFCRDNFFQR